MKRSYFALKEHKDILTTFIVYRGVLREYKNILTLHLLSTLLHTLNSIQLFPFQQHWWSCCRDKRLLMVCWNIQEYTRECKGVQSNLLTWWTRFEPAISDELGPREREREKERERERKREREREKEKERDRSRDTGRGLKPR